jgi:hypothetical protein
MSGGHLLNIRVLFGKYRAKPTIQKRKDVYTVFFKHNVVSFETFNQAFVELLNEVQSSGYNYDMIDVSLRNPLYKLRPSELEILVLRALDVAQNSLVDIRARTAYVHSPLNEAMRLIANLPKTVRSLNMTLIDSKTLDIPNEVWESLPRLKSILWWDNDNELRLTRRPNDLLGESEAETINKI